MGTRIEIRRGVRETLAHAAQGNPATVIVQLRDGLANKRGGRAWGLFGCRRTQIGAFGLFRRRRLRQKIFRVDEASTSLAEALGGFLLTEAIYIDALLADSGSKPCEIPVRRYQAEGVEAPRMQQVHDDDHERNVRSILAGERKSVV